MSGANDTPFTSFKHHFLLAMPGLDDPHFDHALIYLAEHTADGAMGFIVNQQLNIPLSTVFKQLQLSFDEQCGLAPLFDGGPVQRDRGFILHPAGRRQWQSTTQLHSDICLTASQDILADMALGRGPEAALVTIGYSAWSAGQLERELADNVWLILPGDSDILFHTPFAERSQAAARAIGLDLNALAHDAGHA